MISRTPRCSVHDSLMSLRRPSPMPSTSRRRPDSFDTLREFWADAFDHAAGQIAPQAFGRSRRDAGDGFRLELLAVRRVTDPLAFRVQLFTLPHGCAGSHDGHDGVALADTATMRLHRADGVAGLVVSEDDRLHGAGDGFKRRGVVVCRRGVLW